MFEQFILKKTEHFQEIQFKLNEHREELKQKIDNNYIEMIDKTKEFEPTYFELISLEQSLKETEETFKIGIYCLQRDDCRDEIEVE
jgi:hypothetical protein